MNKIILLIENDKRLKAFWTDVLQDEGFCVFAVDSEEALSNARDSLPDMVFIGTGLDQSNVRNLLEDMRKENPEFLVISPTNPQEVIKELEAIQMQGLDYREHPVRIDQVRAAIREALRLRELKERYNFKNLLGKSQKMQGVFEAMSSVIKSHATSILILGETGTGKEEVAKAIHYNSDRAEKPFLALSCTALPETLMESELFGHEAGAFTDARTFKKGLLELADGGSVLLDEIGDMKAVLQSKLLRFLEEKKFRRIGGTKDISVDARVIASTNKNLEKMVVGGDFRDDLYYRLKVFPINLPPLRERKEDIQLLSKYFVEHFNLELKKKIEGLTFSAKDKLLNYNWPGNVRELRNVIERAMILCPGDFISQDELILEGGGEAEIIKELSLEENEKRLIRLALARTNNNYTRTAELLGISRFALRNRIKKYGIV